MHLNVDLAAAAMILALVLNGGPMPQAAIAEGATASDARMRLAGTSLVVTNRPPASPAVTLGRDPDVAAGRRLRSASSARCDRRSNRCSIG
jgi:hypothetical protein